MEIPWRGRLVETPYGWGVCVKEAENQLEVDLDWRLEHGRAKCWTRPDQLRRSSFCALGTCVQTSFGPGVLLQYRREDDVHEVQLWGPLSQRHRAYLRRDALKRVIPAMPGLAVETPQGPGICKAVSGDSLSIAWPWGRGELRSDEVTCPAAKTLPLVSRFLDAAVQLVRLHSGTLLRLAEALNGVGLEQLQEQLAAKAGEAVNTAMNLWEDWEAKEDQEVAKELHSQVEQAMPELQGVVGGLVSGLNQLLCRVQGFDGTWVGQADGEARCVIKDAVLVWHWGQDSELEIWSPESISTLLEGEIFRGKKLVNGSLEWSDGDVWVRTDGPAEEESEVDLPQLNESLQSLRQMVTGAMPADLSEVDLEERLQEAMKCVKDIATTASADEEVKKLASALESEMEHCQDQLSFIQQELLESKAGSVLLEGRRRLSVQLAELQETAITPQLDAMQQRSKRFLTRLATDKKVKTKASELLSAVEQRCGGLEDWIATVRRQVLQQLGLNRAQLVEGLSSLRLEKADLRAILASASWEQTAQLETQLESSILEAMKASGLECSGTELLERFESSDSFSSLPALRRSSDSLLSLLKDLKVEIPLAVQKLLEAQAAGRTADAQSWKAALKSSLDDELLVNGASGLVEHTELMMAKLQELKGSQVVARVVEQLESEDIERQVLSRIHAFNPSEALSTAEAAWSNMDTREQLVNELKDTCLDFILKILPAIQIEKVSGKDNDCEWELSNINFSDFSFRKENVRVTLGEGEDLLWVKAWDISAHFYNLKVMAKPDAIPIRAECVANAKAEGMSLDLAFRWANDKKALVMSSRKIQMESLELWVLETDWSVSAVVNALTYLFADVLKTYACEKIASKLDEHMGVLVEGLNHCLVSCAPLLDRLGLSFEAHAKDRPEASRPEPRTEPLRCERRTQEPVEYVNPLAALG